MDILLGVTELEEVGALIERLRAKPSWSDAEVERLIACIEEVKDESDAVFKCLMRMPPELFGRISAKSRSFARLLVESFSDHVKGQGWPFEYTDEIADISLRPVRCDQGFRNENKIV